MWLTPTVPVSIWYSHLLRTQKLKQVLFLKAMPDDRFGVLLSFLLLTCWAPFKSPVDREETVKTLYWGKVISSFGENIWSGGGVWVTYPLRNITPTKWWGTVRRKSKLSINTWNEGIFSYKESWEFVGFQLKGKLPLSMENMIPSLGHLSYEENFL